MRAKAPNVPTAGENIASAIAATLDNQQALRDMDRSNQLFDIETLESVGPQYTQLLLDFEDMYGSAIRNSQANATGEERANELANITALSPAFQEAVAAGADPESERMRNVLAQQIFGDLSAGAGMTPELTREVQQGVRQGQSARGMTRGTAPIAEEAFARGSRGLQLKQMRQQAAQDFMKTTAATRPDAFQFITGRGAGPIASPGVAPQTGTNVFDSAMGQSAAANNLQSQLSFNSRGGGAKGALGGAAAGASAGAAFGPWGAAIGGVLGGIGGSM
jgi:hypothetical protein